MTTAFDKQAQAYIDASGSSSAARGVKSQIYGVGKQSASVAERTASAPALPERIGADADASRLVTQFAHVSAPVKGHINNMWENLTGAKADEPQVWVSVCDEDFGEVPLLLTDTGKTVTELVRVPSSSQACMGDWINFNVLEDTFFKTARRTLVTDDEIVEEASRVFEETIFGFGVTQKRAVGLNFYRESWVLGDGMGFVCFGGQRSTLMVVLNGQGCHSALPGWEKRLYDFLTKVAVRPVISRIDLAHDDIEGDYLSVDWADAQWSERGFSFKKGGRPCEIRHLGNWKDPRGKGRTLTLGLRSSSKFCRFYERGMMLGDRTSRWCRCEIEFKSTNSVIPLDILLNPTPYFVGAYPCISQFAQVSTPKRMAVKVKSAQISFDTAVAITKRQYGKYIRVFRSLFDTEQQLLDAISHPDEGVWPKRLRPYLIDATSGPSPIHRQSKFDAPDFVPFPSTVPSFGLHGDYGFLGCSDKEKK